VQEGLEIFHETLEKLNTCATPNQKEKVETDLKKEIKKLQRLRDQIKGWQQLSEIKDKGPLNEGRRAIETEMERFKVLEKEMKIKAFSKEGLSLTAKLDPREKERMELDGWLSDTVDVLNTGTDAFEAEMESLRLGAKKRKLEPAKQARLDSLQALTDRHRHHIKKLELIRRLLENERLEIEAVRGIQEDVEYYLEAHQEADFVENEELYDELDLAASASDDDEDSDCESGSESDSDNDDGKTGSQSTSKVSPVAKTAPVVVKSLKSSGSLGETSVAPVKAQPLPALVPAQAITQQQQQPAVITIGTPRMAPPPISPKAAGPSFASAAGAATAATSPTTSSAPISFAAAAKPSASDGQHMTAAHRPAAGYEELLAHLSASAGRAQPRSRSDILAILTASHQNCPDGYETESSRAFIPRNPVPTPDYYPTAPPPILENPAIFERLDLDTLFFIFYYQQQSYPQYLAARELKRQSWRFHKKYLTWFQRHEEPKSITDEYEQGTYIYFDYESAWCQRKKTEFTFEYRFLEDEESV